VRWIQTIWCVVDASKRDAHGVQPSNLSNVHWCDSGALLVCCVASQVQAQEEEIFSHNILCILAWEPIRHALHQQNHKLDTCCMVVGSYKTYKMHTGHPVYIELK
jgi:hypothetical protein